MLHVALRLLHRHQRRKAGHLCEESCAVKTFVKFREEAAILAEGDPSFSKAKHIAIGVEGLADLNIAKLTTSNVIDFRWTRPRPFRGFDRSRDQVKIEKPQWMKDQESEWDQMRNEEIPNASRIWPPWYDFQISPPLLTSYLGNGLQRRIYRLTYSKK